jgi:hypothetical protein
MRMLRVFWVGGVRQTANAHVQVGHNGEGGRQVFRLSQIIGDVGSVFSTWVCPPSPYTKVIGSRNHRSNWPSFRRTPPAFLDLYLFVSHLPRCCGTTSTIREWECNHPRVAPKLDSCYTLLTWWTWCDAHEGASLRTLWLMSI